MMTPNRIRPFSNRPAWALLLIATAGCGRAESDSKPSDTLTASAASTRTPATPFYAVLGHHAEQTYDYIKAADWAKARASLDSITAAARGARAQEIFGHERDVTESLARLDTAVAQRSRLQGVREANRLTQLGALLAAANDPPIPASVTMLDFYGRELEIGAEANDTAKLSNASMAIKNIWEQQRPLVVARGGTAEAARFDSVVANVTAARTPAQYARAATPLLDDVDALEAVFSK
jgi:hypothetical protein